ncbi:MAG TPA: sialidase family protein, partial [Burkholderiales bacterium]|nr:sialidase family protein [Burkholderiales bacterium]
MQQLYVATRKGLFIIDPARWALAKPHFLGDPVSAVLAHGGAIYAALNLGHFGVKLRRSDDGGQTWQEIAAPTYPRKPAGTDDKTEWKLVQVWTMEAAGDTLWAGTNPGGLFRSRDRGESWSLVHSLWDRKERTEWFGGGYDSPGIHSICIDPRDARKLTIAVSCGGVWQSADGAERWHLAASGMHADYFPPERKHDQNIQDVHRMVQAPSQPEVLYAQHHNGVFRSA